MRHIKKAQPPPNVAPRDQAARTLKQGELALRAGLTTAADRARHARESHFDTLNKDALRRALIDEQRHLCVYCERRLSIQEDEEPLPIEHWRPLSRNPELALTWRNLYLSCSNPDTCDAAKRNQRLSWADEDEDLPWPSDAPYEDWIGVSRGGELYVRTDAPLSPTRRRALVLALSDQTADGRTRPAILNLNHPALVSARKAAIDLERSSASRAYPEQMISRENRVSRSMALQTRDPLPSFVSARIAWWKNELGKGR